MPSSSPPPAQPSPSQGSAPQDQRTAHDSARHVPSSEVLFALGVERSIAHREILEDALNHGTAEQRVIAARALGWLRAPQCARALITGLDDSDPEVRRWVSASLSLSWSDQAGVALINRFQLELSGEARAAILRTLGWRRLMEAELLCVTALSDDEEPQVRGEAAKALGRINPHDHVIHLLRATSDVDPTVRRHAVRALTDCVSSSKIDRESSREARSQVEEALQPASALTTLLHHAEHDEDAEVRSVALRALTHHPDPEVYACLIRSLDDPNPCVRVNATVALGQRDDPRACLRLRDGTHDPHPEVRARAADALRRLESIEIDS